MLLAINEADITAVSFHFSEQPQIKTDHTMTQNKEII